jgi:hypothetical protein
VKYMLLIYQNPASWQEVSQDEKDAVMAEAGDIWQELIKSGECIGGEALADVSATRTIRVRDGVPVVTDGPYVESKEQLAGYVLLECDSPQRAVEIAVRWPDARYWAVELRPLMQDAGVEM